MPPSRHFAPVSRRANLSSVSSRWVGRLSVWKIFCRRENLSQCHPEAVAEGSRICKELQSLDSSPPAQNDIRVIFALHTVSSKRRWAPPFAPASDLFSVVVQSREICRGDPPWSPENRVGTGAPTWIGCWKLN